MEQLNFLKTLIEKKAHYKGENYLAREDGSVFRVPKNPLRLRKYDGYWTYGHKSTDGYMRIGDAQIHRVIAIAFHGAAPSDDHVVDHKDTNKINNHASNLQWVTPLENLNNPKTKAKIERLYGSISSMLEHRKNYGKWDVNPSMSKHAAQKNWRTKSWFPMCPELKPSSDEEICEDQIKLTCLWQYYDNLEYGTMFSYNEFGRSITDVATISKDGTFISVLCRLVDQLEKEWAVTKIYIDNGHYLHESIGAYFCHLGAIKAHYDQLGIGLSDTFENLLAK